MAGRKITFMGDSLSRQHWQSLSCHLKNFIVKAPLKWEKHKWVGPVNCPFEGNKFCYSSNSECGTFENGVEVCLHEPEDIPKAISYLTGIAGSKDILVPNVGAHYQGALRHLVTDVHKFASELGRWQKAGHDRLVIWREVSPQHFDSNDGNFLNSASHIQSAKSANGEYGCKATSDAAKNNWRNIAINPIIKEHNIPILYIFNHSLTQWDAHVSDNLKVSQTES